MNSLYVSPEDEWELARIAQAEGGGLTKVKGVSPRQAYGSVVDTVLNRQASGQFAPTIKGVISQKGQFEPVTRYGGVDNLPPPSKEALAETRAYIADRAKGGQPVTEKATHFLNPYYSGQNALNGWARDWQSWPSIGSGTNQHRFASLTSVPDYQISTTPPEPATVHPDVLQGLRRPPEASPPPADTSASPSVGMGSVFPSVGNAGWGQKAPGLLNALGSALGYPSQPQAASSTTPAPAQPVQFHAPTAASATTGILGALGSMNTPQQPDQMAQLQAANQAANNNAMQQRYAWASANGY